MSTIVMRILDLGSASAGLPPLLNDPYYGFTFKVAATGKTPTSFTLASQQIDDATTYPQLLSAFKNAIAGSAYADSMMASYGKVFTVRDYVTGGGGLISGQEIQLTAPKLDISLGDGSGFLVRSVPANTYLYTNSSSVSPSELKGGVSSFDASNREVTYQGYRHDYNIMSKQGELSVKYSYDSRLADPIDNVDHLRFSDIYVDVRNTGVVQALYISYFGRPADPSGLVSFQAQLSGLPADLTLAELSQAYNYRGDIRNLIDSFGYSAESRSMYSGDTQTFINAVYHNIFNRAADDSGLAFWSNAIDSGALTKANASLSIMAGAQSNMSAQGLADAALVSNKIDVASNFTFALDALAKSQAYAGNNAAAIARAMLSSVSSQTDVAKYQAQVDSAIASMPSSPRFDAAPAPTDAATSGAEIALVGIAHGAELF